MSDVKEHTEESNGISNGSPAHKRLKKDVENGEEASIDSDSEKDFQLTLEDIDACQLEIDSLNEKASEEILKVEQKYNELRKPLFEKRNEYIKKIPGFWVQAIVNHSQLRVLLSTEEEECIKHLKNIEIEEFEDIKSGYRIKFHFDENPFFENKVLVKEFHLASGDPTCTSTAITWKNTEEGKNLRDVVTNKQRKSKVEITFFLWFLENGGASFDDIGEVIKDDLWLNPLQYFLLTEMEANSAEESDDDDNVVEIEDEDEELDEENDEEIDDDVENLNDDDNDDDV